MAEIPHTYAKTLKEVAKESKELNNKIQELQESLARLNEMSRSVWAHLDNSDIDQEDLEDLQKEIDDILEPPLEEV